MKKLKEIIFGLCLLATIGAHAQDITEIGKILPTPYSKSTNLGEAIAMDGNIAVVGDWGDEELVEDGGSAYILEFDGTDWNTVARLSASDITGTSWFGWSVAVDGTTVAIGAPKAGAVYIYEQPASGWSDMTENEKLTPPAGYDHIHFGYSVALSSGKLAIGDNLDRTNFTNAGAVHIYDNTVSWTYETTVISSDLGPSDQFGYSVAMDGNNLAVGAYAADNKGAVFVFEYSTAWAETAKLIASDATLSDRLGTSVDIEGTTIVAGDPKNFVSAVENGSVYVYENPGSGWTSGTESQKLFASDAASFDNFGTSVSLSNSTLIVGSINHDDQGTNSGGAYLFEFNGTSGNWEEQAIYGAADGSDFDFMGKAVAISGDNFLVDGGRKVYQHTKSGGAWSSALLNPTDLVSTPNSSLDGFGFSIAMENGIAVVGLPDADQDGAPDVGLVYVFEFNGSTWNQVATLTPSDPPISSSGPNNTFGAKVAISGETIVVSDPNNDAPFPDCGAIYVYEEPADGWQDMTETQKLTYSGKSNLERLGSSVAIDGDIIVAGTPRDDGRRGSAILYTKSGTWSEDVTLEASDREVDDLFGISVAIQGNTIVAGATGDDALTGAIYIFDDTGTQLSKLTADDGIDNDRLGISVAFENTTIAAGAFAEDTYSGAVYVFENPGTWPTTMTETQKLVATDRLVEDQFGYSLSLSSNRLLIGALGKNLATGAAYLFENSGTWSEIEKLTASDGATGDLFGYVSAIEGNLMLLGAIKHTDSFFESGAVYAFNDVPPLGAIVTGPGDATNTTPIPITVTFSEAVASFDPFSTPGDVSLTNATLTGASTNDDITFTLNIAPLAEGTVEVIVPEAVAVDYATGLIGNSSSNVYSIEYDVTPPNAAALATYTLNLEPDGSGTLAGADIDNGSNDANGIALLEVSQENFDCTDIEDNPHSITLIVTDNAGNTSTATTEVSVAYGAYVDNTLPTVVIQDLEVTLDVDGNATITAEQIDDGSNDDCGVQSLELDRTTFTCADEGNNTVTLTVTDLYGNTNTATANVEVTASTLWYQDNDEDGFGDAANFVTACNQPSGFVADNTDCDDSDADEFPGKIWYADTDGDGFGDGTSIQVACEQPVGYVSNFEDCDDTNASVNPNVLWYEDADGDGYGNPANSEASCTQPQGFVQNADDCDDADANEFPGQIWYADTDGDGFGDVASTQVACEQPAGFTIDNTDCDDTDADEFPGQTWYVDGDDDGFGDPGTILVQCIKPLGYILNNTDCDDGDANEFPGQTWYLDADGDGFGDNEDTQVACEQPAGFVLDNTDCNDASGEEYPGKTWYADTDGDGFGDPANSQIACERPDGYITDNIDCDDNDATKFPGQRWYADSDGDGFGDPTNIWITCNQPLGFILDNTDCDDGDASEFPGQTWYEDADGDGFGNEASTLVACERPAGYVQNASDCDDTDSELLSSVWYQDSDGDGYGNPANVLNQCTQPAGYVANDQDCDDTDASVNPTLVWYADGDGDGFGDPNVTLVQCTQPAQYVANNTDCDDSDANEYPGQTWYADTDDDGYGDPANSQVACEQPVGFVLDDTDCDDSDADEYPGQTWYADTDSDGYGDASNSQVACEQPAGFILDNTDCDDGDWNEFPGQTWYADSDGDGFGSPANSQIACEQPAGFILDNTDCDDDDADEFPGQTWYPDTDGDGLGDTGNAQVACERPTGFILDNTDCDDNDANVSVAQTWYADSDGDGFGDPDNSQQTCEQPDGFILDNSDCDDTSNEINPDGVDTAGTGIDSNCNGNYLWYIDADGDGFGSNQTVSSTNTTPSTGESEFNTDCDDSDSSVYPGAPESGDGIDKNCDGLVLSVFEDEESKVYPNPTDDRVTLPNNIMNGSEVFIYSLNGSLSGKLTVEDDQISLKVLSNGTYLLRAKDVNGKIREWKVVKVKTK